MLNNSHITNQLKKKKNHYIKNHEKNIITAIKAHYRVKHKGTIEKVRRKRINAIDAAITARNGKTNNKVHAYFRNKRNYGNRKQFTSNNSNQMIKANELRTGNLLEYYIESDNLGWQFSTIEWQDIRESQEKNESFNSGYRGIDLTEKLLLMVGYSVVNENSAGKRYGYIIEGNYRSDLVLIFWKKTENKGKFFRDGLRHEIKFLHSLQNIHFALTGEELTIKKN